MDEKDIIEIFEKMVKNISSKQNYHAKKQTVYKGEHTAKTLNIALPKEFDRKLITNLSWAKTAVDTLQNDLQFDAFENDTLGFTRLFSDANGYAASESAIKNSMIGACSFVSVLPGKNGRPFFNAFTGAEASGIFSARDGFTAGLTVNSYTDDFVRKVKDYLLFIPGYIIKISFDGSILEVVETGTEKLLLVPFIYDEDTASSPFGSSRINAPAVNALESALRTMKVIEFGNDNRIALRNILMAGGGDPSDLSNNTTSPNLMNLLTIFNEGSGNLSLEQVVAPDTAELQNMLGLLANNFASSVGMSSTAFGYHPRNGSFGDTATEENSKPYNNLVRKQRENYGRSIKELAIAAMSLASGQYINEWEAINPVFIDRVPTSQFGAVADGIQKLSVIAPEADFSEFIEKRLLGKTVREEALTVSLPNFYNSQKMSLNYEKLRSNSDSVF